MTDALREALQELVDADDALAAHQARGYMVGDAWDFDDTQRRLSARRAEARTAARTALQEPAPVVAREPTPKMMLAGATALYGEEEARDQACRDAAADCWYAMYNAAPQAPVEPAPVVQPEDDLACKRCNTVARLKTRTYIGCECGWTQRRVPNEDAAQLVEDARAKVIEEAAKVCDAYADRAQHMLQHNPSAPGEYMSGRANCAEDCAAAIRALGAK